MHETLREKLDQLEDIFTDLANLGIPLPIENWANETWRVIDDTLYYGDYLEYSADILARLETDSDLGIACLRIDLCLGEQFTVLLDLYNEITED